MIDNVAAGKKENYEFSGLLYITKKTKFSWVLCAHSQFLCSLARFDLANQGVRQPFQLHTFSARMRGDISAASFCSCKLLWLTFNAQPDIFAVMNLLCGSVGCIFLQYPNLERWFSSMTHKTKGVRVEEHANYVNKLRQNVGLETWIRRQIVTSQTTHTNTNDQNMPLNETSPPWKFSAYVTACLNIQDSLWRSLGTTQNCGCLSQNVVIFVCWLK